MTIINDIEIDDIVYKRDPVKNAILKNKPIEEKLHVIIVISNPCLYAQRYILAREFINRIETTEEHVILYIVEMTYGDQKFILTEEGNPQHLQLRTEIPIWHKENMVNLGVKYLLPETWKAMAWIDADVEFESSTWALDTLKLLNGYADIVQLFSIANDMDEHNLCMSTHFSFCRQYSKGHKYCVGKDKNYWHPGYAWACTKEAYEQMGGLIDHSILGSGDYLMAMSFIGAVKTVVSSGFSDYILKFQKRAKNMRLSYVPGMINHYYHGSKANRKYRERNEILVSNKFNPYLHLTTDETGIVVPSKLCPPKMLDDIVQYFRERNEDESLKHKKIHRK